MTAFQFPHAPAGPYLVTDEDMEFTPFTPEEIERHIQQGDDMSMAIYQVGPNPDEMDCALVLGNLSAIAQQLSLEVEKLRGQLAGQTAPRAARRKGRAA